MTLHLEPPPGEDGIELHGGGKASEHLTLLDFYARGIAEGALHMGPFELPLRPCQLEIFASTCFDLAEAMLRERKKRIVDGAKTA